jgi:M6 family metalloprotease-like protein
MRGDKYLKTLSVKLIGSLTFSLLMIFIVTNVSAAPAAPLVSTISQPDGNKFQATAWGDEWLNGVETTDGYTIDKDPETGYWFYVLPENEGRSAPQYGEAKPMIVGLDDPSGLPKHIRPSTDPVTDPQIYSQLRGSSAESRQSPTTGTHKILVLLVEFENYAGSTSVASWHDKIFGPSNSINHYYQEVSFGKLDLAPAEESHGVSGDGIVGWIKLEGFDHPYSSDNPNYTGMEKSQEIVQKALLAANDFVNFASFDIDGDGFIAYDELHIMLIVAGFEGAYGGRASACRPYIWAHFATLDGYSPVLYLDGKRMGLAQGGGGYTQFGEIHCDLENSPGNPATIGIIAHEFGHDLNLPDLYDISLKTEGIGYWGLMSHGMWNRSNPTSAHYGDSPAHPTAWSRWYQGWLSPYQITSSSLDVNIPPVAINQTVFQLRDNPFGVDWTFFESIGLGEYYLIENRQPIGYDVGLPGFGLLIWHIDENVTASNFANANPNNRLVDLVQADGLRQLNLLNGNRGDPGDPFPGSTLNTIFNTDSNPSSDLYDGIISGVSVNDIRFDESGLSANLFVTSFEDVAPDYWSWKSIEAMKASGLTIGCEAGQYCPGGLTSRAEMAVFLGRVIYGADYDLPPASGEIFEDVQANYWAAAWIEQLYRDGITRGCSTGPLLFCPEEKITRREMAVFLVRFIYGDEDAFGEPTGIFTDVPVDDWATIEIEQLYLDGITLGCATSPDLLFCPNDQLTRAEVAVFLERTFNLPVP